MYGVRLSDPNSVDREWTVIGLTKPVSSHGTYGIRVRVVDQLGFTSFIQQQDLELLAGLAKPGTLCPWTSSLYPEIGDEANGWRGLYMDFPELEDDLQIREYEIRAEAGWGRLPELELTRYLHLGHDRDVERLEVMTQDFDPVTGGPDLGISTINRRWQKVQQEGVAWG